MAEPSLQTAPPSEAKPQSGAAPSNFSRSTRETIESIAIAFALAFLFKTFQAEAFVIPTGSMAPTLMGRHKDLVCPACGFQYTTSGSDEADREGNLKRTDSGAIDAEWQVVRCTCPVCRFPLSTDPQDPQAVNEGTDATYSGDRIWVSKVAYQIAEPRRWEIIVFRCPVEAETYYIKRLVGLPNEAIRLFHGDLYTRGPQASDFQIQRKPPDKVLAMAQVVHDNDYVSPGLVEGGWPLRWQPWGAIDRGGRWSVSDDTRAYQTDGNAEGEAWIRYQHIVPSPREWQEVYERRFSPAQPPRPQLITDFYAFNSKVLRREIGSAPWSLGLHWVGDLMLECELDAQGSSGLAMLDLVKGGRHFRCEFDVADGRATLAIDDQPNWRPHATTTVRGPGRHRVRFANFDEQLLLWVDDHLVVFDQATTYAAKGPDRPVSTEADRGDLAPLGVGSRGLALGVNHLRVLRDVYYIADDGTRFRPSFDPVISDFRGAGSVVPMMRSEALTEFLATPGQWETALGHPLFDERQELVFRLGEDQFFAMGDNSPASYDARLWPKEHYVSRELLVGKALFVYWPHPLDLQIPFTDVSLPVLPNFEKMGVIR